MKLIINDLYYLAPLTEAGLDSLVEYLNDPTIQQNTASLPFPYTMESAEWWLNFTSIINSRELMNFQIYTTENELIGGCGFMSMPTDEPAEFGYWTAPPYWNKGVQTAAVKRLLAYGFQELRIAEVVAYAYSWNEASARVLHKAGLMYQGIIPNKMTVKGRRIDCHHFTMTREEWEQTNPIP